MDKILEVKNLKISFRTNGGTVKAVRDISFDLERGKTLAIVGESGSGKSVTSKAILGILAGNSIIEGGEILYDGKDLLKIGEEDMYKIRGDKVSMIFQDPLSSLNPIVKIGQQITEAMLLKNKASRREAKAEFNKLLETLQKQMAAAAQAVGSDKSAEAKEMCATFDKFAIEANKLENSFNSNTAEAEGLIDTFEDIIFRVEKKQKVDLKALLKDSAKRLSKMADPFYTKGYKDALAEAAKSVEGCVGTVSTVKSGDNKLMTMPAESCAVLRKVQELLKKMQTQERPDFFCIGFYAMRNPGENLQAVSVPELNAKAAAFLNSEFMTQFVELEQAGVVYSHDVSLAAKHELLSALKEAKTYFAGEFEKKAALDYAAKLSDKVEASIDRLEITKDSVAYTFRTSMISGINKYFHYMKHNPKEEARFAKQTAKRDALIAKGKHVDWKVVPKVVYPLEGLKADLLKVIANLEAHTALRVQTSDTLDAVARCNEINEFLKDKASKVVTVVTREIAKERAIKLMEEVGINEPRMRFYQYPFEFSGGMRQRIVIAIALSADPEILICDEPTTALDVTIQAQILELINRLKVERNLSVIFITHDLGVVANMADDIAVMYAGKIVEHGSAEDIFYDPRHPYTWALLSSMPDLDTKEKLDAIPGTPPNMIYPPVGDAFADRNKYAMQIDFEQQPPMFEISETHRAATWLLHPDAPKVEIPKAITDRIARMKKAGGADNG